LPSASTTVPFTVPVVVASSAAIVRVADHANISPSATAPVKLHFIH
jgi:hypothetical protein